MISQIKAVKMKAEVPAVADVAALRLLMKAVKTVTIKALAA